MIRSSIAAVSTVALGLSAWAVAQQTTPAGGPASGPASASQPAGDAKPAATPAEQPKKSDASSPASTGYPAPKQKQLWAQNDFRGKKGPALEVAEWYGTKEPSTAGKTVLVDFWGIGCPPCRTLIPELEAWQAKFKDDLVVIGLTSDSPKSLGDFEDLRGAKVKYPIACDNMGRAARAVGVQGIPHVIIMSSDGIVRWQGFPLDSSDRLTEATLKQIIDTDKAARAKASKDAKVPAESSEKTDPKPAPKN